MLVKKHNKIIAFSDNVDKLFSFIALFQILSNTPVIVLLTLIAMTVIIAVSFSFECAIVEIIMCSSFSFRFMKQSLHSENDVGLVKTLFAYVGVTAEIFIFCFVGEYFSTKVSEYLKIIYYNSIISSADTCNYQP